MNKSTFSRLLSLLLVVLLCISSFPVLCVPVDSAVAVTQNQKNMVDRADYCYGITWVAQQTVSGWSGTFYQGNTYHIPYGQPINSGKYIGYSATYEEFQKAAATAGSIFYTGRSWYDGPSAPYYVTDCSSFVSWVWGIDRKTTYYIPSVSTNLGSVTTDRATHTLQLGDALNSNAHVVLVSGLQYDASGAITIIEITEQTPPQMKRSYYSPYQLAVKYGKYTIQRYYGDVPVAPGTKQETWIEKAAFDVMVYRDRNQDLAGMTDAQLKQHWLSSGIKEGRASSPVLDLGFYLNNNPDLKNAFGTDYAAAYNHFITSGYKEYRKSSALFDGQYYCDNNADVAANYKENYMLHYVDHGIKEGRRASLTFDPDYYWYIRPDVYKAWPDDYEMCAKHYAGHGINAQIEAYDHSHPVISDAVVTNITSEGYTVSCKVTDNWGISKVVFPTWTLLNNQDDLADNFMNTQQGIKDGDIYTFQVKASDHNYETGAYVTHIYAIDMGGNQTQLVLSTVEVRDPVPLRITLTEVSGYSITDGYVNEISTGTTVSSLLRKFTNESLEVVDCHGNVITGTAAVGTGTKLNLYVDNNLVDSVTIIVPGDTDGNGLVDTTDYIRIKASFLSGFTLDDPQEMAADRNGDGLVNTTDYLRIKSYFLENDTL